MVDQAGRAYSSVTRTMTRHDVYGLLGEPSNVLSDGRLQWRVSDGSQFAELKIKFNEDGSIAEMELERRYRNR